jgi:hypothetical protein
MFVVVVVVAAVVVVVCLFVFCAVVIFIQYFTFAVAAMLLCSSFRFAFSLPGGSEDAKLALAYHLARRRDADCPQAFDLYKAIASRQVNNEAWRPTIELKVLIANLL